MNGGYKNEKRIIVVCRTPYQILVSSRIILSEYPGARVTLVVFDQIANSAEIVTNALCSGLFERVIPMRAMKKEDKKQRRKALFSANFCARRFLNEQITESLGVCDVFLSANVDFFPMAYYHSLKRQARDYRFVFFEDGLSTYSYTMGAFFQSFHAESIGKLVGKMRAYLKSKLHAPYTKTHSIFLFNPPLLTWTPAFSVNKVPPLNVNTTEFMQSMNTIFGYHENEPCYNAPVIFFEESYLVDGYTIDDVNLVNRIADIVGKENIMIKIHPRNKVNRFEQLGYKTNKNTWIPWELIALILDLSKKLLITVSSSAAFTPNLLLGIKTQSVMLYNCVRIDPKYNPLLQSIDNLCKRSPDVFSIPADTDEMSAVIRRQYQSLQP